MFTTIIALLGEGKQIQEGKSGNRADVEATSVSRLQQMKRFGLIDTRISVAFRAGGYIVGVGEAVYLQMLFWR